MFSLFVLLFLALCSVHGQVPPSSGPVLNIPGLPSGIDLVSYSGYITVNEQYNSNMFFWLFESQDGNKDTPLLIWLNGGPGSSSMYGLFAELGPMSVNDDLSLSYRNVSWTNKYHVMFIDNPVGTGMSYTDDVNGFVTSQEDVARDLYAFIQKFYAQYTQFQQNDLYICGESYAGKYVPSFAYKIHSENAVLRSSRSHKHHAHHKHANSGIYVPLVGISIGDGMMDPLTQVVGYGDYLFGLSLIDENQRTIFQQQEQAVVQQIQLGNYKQAFQLFDPLMNGDFYPYPSYFTNFTGISNYYNFMLPNYPNNPFDQYLNRPDVIQAIHTNPGYVYSSGNSTVEYYLLNDWMQSIRSWLVVLLENYKVLIYNGQNDIILNGPMCENFLSDLTWTNSTQFQQAGRTIWYPQNDPTQNPSGYVRQGAGLTYVQVRNAGHLLPQDQPQAAFDMINRFIQDLSFKRQ